MKKFHVELIKPSHYDDDGYVIQWVRAFIPSNSLACVRALVQDVKDREVLGPDVALSLNAADESHTVIRPRQVIRRIRAAGAGMVMLVGVQSNQFPRAADLAREFRAAGIDVAIGGFHVSGCIAMLPELPADIQEMKDLGVVLFAGEAEGRMEGLLRDATNGAMASVYNYMGDLPSLENAVTPFLPKEITRRYMLYTSFDAGRGCPFNCSFCTIINVQGRKSRYRDADDVERLVRRNWEQGVRRFFITDDNFARNRNWEAIFDRLIALREEGIRVRFVIQVDMMTHKIAGFTEKAGRAGCNKVLIGLENINPDNLADIGKKQNVLTEYRDMLLAWRNVGVVTYAGYILGLPADTPESIARDIRVIQEELPIDILEFFVLTPLPGSADHQRLGREGVWMDPDMNKYDLEHVTTRNHPKMSPEEVADIYRQVWELYYSPQHIETLMRRAVQSRNGVRRIRNMIMQFYGTYVCERLHPLQAGVFRRKIRTSRRSGFPRENPIVFYPRRVAEVIATHWRIVCMFGRLKRIERRVMRDPERLSYTDKALTPVGAAENKHLQLFNLTDSAKDLADKAEQRALTKAASSGG